MRFSALLVLILCFCSSARAAHTEYDRIFPYYAEICSVSEQKIQPGISTPARGGGIAGHTALYLKGACKEHDALYPRLKLCDVGTTDLSDSDSGTGVSVDSAFRNVNWVGVERKSFFLDGDLAPDEPLTLDRFHAAVEQAMQSGQNDGIIGWGRFAGDPARLALASLGTDYAIRWGRNSFCAYFPMSRQMLGKAVDYLNSVNRLHAEGGVDYHWSAIFDNCVHLSHNALAAIGIWKPIRTGQGVARQLFNLAIPGNEFVHAVERVSESPIGEDLDVAKIFARPWDRKTLLRWDWLSSQPGALIETRHAHRYRNDVYRLKHLRMMILDVPLIGKLARAFHRALRPDARLHDLRANLEEFHYLYRSSLNRKRSLQWYQSNGHGNGWTSLEFSAFYERYYRYIERKLAETDAELSSLRARRGD